jgi:hypothetical protein
MPRILAIDWDRTEVRCLLASTTGPAVKIHLAASSPLATVAEAGETSHPDVGGSLRILLADPSIGRPNTVVAADRFAVETFLLTLPPAKDSELASLVHNQVLRDAQTFSEGSVIDFVPLTDDPEGSRLVSAAILPAGQLARIREACAEIGVRPTRIALRPLATASYFREAMPGRHTCMLVNVIGDEADLTLIVEGNPAFFRTVRLPPGAEDHAVARQLTSEVQRTLVAAVRGSTAAGAVDRIYVFGSPQEHPLLVGQLEATIGVPAANFDPFDAGGSVEFVGGAEVPAGSGKYASLLGMVIDESRGTHPIDFLHPRRMPKPPDRRRLVKLAALLLFGAVAAGGYSYWDALERVQQENVELSKTLKDLDKRAREASPDILLLEDLEAWRQTEIVWLDELRDLAQRLPPARDLLVQRMSVSTSRGGAGEIDLQCLGRDSAVVGRLARSLRDDYHMVGGSPVGDRAQGSGFSWSFNPRISVWPRTRELYRNPPAESPAAETEPVAPAEPAEMPKAATPRDPQAEPTTPDAAAEAVSTDMAKHASKPRDAADKNASNEPDASQDSGKEAGR